MADAIERDVEHEQDVPGDAILVVDGVDGGYGELQVLYDLTLYVEPGEIVCTIGPNGAGKSTVVKTIFGLLEPWSGTIELRGEDITGERPEDVVRKGLGYVPQVENVFSSLTVAENLEMGAVARDDADAVIAELYERFPLLADRRATKARNLSGGQRQILALARALVMEPDVLLIDEPSAGLAPALVDDVLAHIERINEFGTAILMIEQNARQGLHVADRGYVLDQGRVAFEDDADDILERPKIRELYLGG